MVKDVYRYTVEGRLWAKVKRRCYYDRLPYKVTQDFSKMINTELLLRKM